MYRIQMVGLELFRNNIGVEYLQLSIMSVLHNVFWVLNTKSLFSYREVDQDSDGHIGFKEFESAMKYGQDEVSPVYFA